MERHISVYLSGFLSRFCRDKGPERPKEKENSGKSSFCKKQFGLYSGTHGHVLNSLGGIILGTACTFLSDCQPYQVAVVLGEALVKLKAAYKSWKFYFQCYFGNKINPATSKCNIQLEKG